MVSAEIALQCVFSFIRFLLLVILSPQMDVDELTCVKLGIGAGDACSVHCNRCACTVEQMLATVGRILKYSPITSPSKLHAGGRWSLCRSLPSLVDLRLIDRRAGEIEVGCSDSKRFELELEFVQLLANPAYLNCERWEHQDRPNRAVDAAKRPPYSDRAGAEPIL